MSFLPWVLLRYHSYIKERTLVPLSPLFSFRIRHYPQWSNDFFAHSDTVFTYVRNDTWAFNIQLSQQTSSIRTSNAGKNKGSEALKRQRMMISFFKWHSSVLCYWTLIWNHHFSSIKTALISQTALSKCLGKHLKFWSMTFQLRKQSPSSFLLRALHAPGNGRAKIPGWFPRPLGLNIPCSKSLPNLYTSYD